MNLEKFNQSLEKLEEDGIFENDFDDDDPRVDTKEYIKNYTKFLGGLSR